MTPTLESRRLILRPVRITDAPEVQKYFSSWNIIRNMGANVPWPYPLDGAQTFLQDSALPRMERNEALIWAITRKGSDELIGIVEFRLNDSEEGHRGFWLAEPFWGQGLMREAVFAVNDYIFDVLKCEDFVELCNATNIASHKLKVSSGGTFEKIRDKIGPGGSKEQSEIWRMTREDWAAAKTARLSPS